MKNKNILITGGLGFIGSHFAEYIHEVADNCTVTIVDKKSYCVSRQTEEYIWNLYGSKKSNSLSIIYKDIRLINDISTYDYIVNFAAESHVDNSINNGDPFMTSNVNGVYNLLSLLNDRQRFVQIGTDEVYGSLSFEAESSIESDTLYPSSVYSSTKAAADLIALSFHKTHKRDIVITRCTNNFGPRQYHEKLIPVVVKKALADEPIPVYGDGRNVRQWIYVKEHCEKIYNIMLHGQSGEVYNIAPQYESEIDNLTIVKEILSALEKPESLISFVTDRKGHDFRYSLNDNKYKINLMKGKPVQLEFETTKKTFAEDLRNTIMWYKQNYDWWGKKSYN